MTDTVLVLNAGSSSLKFAIFEMAGGLPACIRGAISSLDYKPKMKVSDCAEKGSIELDVGRDNLDIPEAMDLVLKQLAIRGHLDFVKAIGHRIVHGGREFKVATVLNENVIGHLRELVPLAPMHQPRNLEIIAQAARALPQAMQYGCFDTAFHHTRPHITTLYGLSHQFTEQGIISYGFHGISYDYIASRLREKYGSDAGNRAIVAHLGSGASLCAMNRGLSVATTMGFSTLDGLIMATRSGSLDPGVVLHMLQEQHLSAQEVEDILYNRSGLLGVSGISGDMETLLASNQPSAKEAINLFIYRISQQIASMAAALEGMDTLVFCAGIGEHSPLIREKIGEVTRWLGVEIDQTRNWRGDEDITATSSKVNILILPTDEERAVAKEVLPLRSFK